MKKRSSTDNRRLFARSRAPLRVVTTWAAALVLAGCAATLTPAELAVEYLNLGNAYFELGRFEDAGQYFLRAVDLDPSLNRAGYNLARAYIEQGRPSEAVPILEELLGEDPDNRLVMEALGYAHYDLGNAEEALNHYDRLVRLSVVDPRILFNAGYIHQEFDNDERAFDLYSLAAEITPDDADIQWALAQTAFAIDEIEAGLAAAQAYRDLLGAPPEAADTLEELGDLYREYRYYDRALEAYDAAAAGEAAARVVFKRAEILLTEAGELELGLEALQRAVELGFSDTAAAQALLEREELVDPQAVELALRNAGLLAEATSDDQPPDESAVVGEEGEGTSDGRQDTAPEPQPEPQPAPEDPAAESP